MNQTATKPDVTTDPADVRRTRRLSGRAFDRLSTFRQNRKDRAAVRRYWRTVMRRLPHEFVLEIASIIARHPDVRKAFKAALHAEDKKR